MTDESKLYPGIGNWKKISAGIKKDDIREILSTQDDWSDSQFEESIVLYEKFVNCQDSFVAPLIRDALCHVDQAYRLYGPSSVLCSFNGGKDAVVILELLRAAAAHYYRTKREIQPEVKPKRPRVIYFDHKDEFPEIVEFLNRSVCNYDLDMITFEEGISFPTGLSMLVEHSVVATTDHKIPVSFVLGTRATDPNAGNQGHFAPSSHYMPPFMRVNPILNWNYGHVWHFLRLFKLPYCQLYDQGYTSLGTVKDTFPCPALEVAGSSFESDVPRFWPAYMLQDWDLERAGRIKKDKDKPRTSLPRMDSKKSLETDMSTVTDLDAGESRSGRAPINTVHIPVMNEEETAVTTVGDSIGDDGDQRTVGLLIIGDEILKGLTADANAQAAAKALREQNVPLAKVVFVSDCSLSIEQEIKRLQLEVDIVITSGGVGPTHDDVTIKSVANALGKEMAFHEGMAELLRNKMDDGKEGKPCNLTQAQIKMSTLPSNAKLKYISEDKTDWPTLQCRNIFILPGVPQYFAKKINDLAKYLSTHLERSATYKVVLSVDEASIVPILNDAVDAHPNVSFGSYPFVGRPDFQTVLTLESRPVESRKDPLILSKDEMDNNVKRALDHLIHELEERESGSILRVENNDGLSF
eukprot:CAMPEP_0178925948 /NCGR_PEP_ID=MMETSP0786-20121207/18225_1 /TAXON_ID=186022 /ORGANISM="Thalassionema frauenfeldii, Strain CCMP 1798" /LENGTH=636 /DNA_ID=CAMNT_0020600945 /DNA_START=121 /DNA_END=2031 /DNA_ORIENTATION=+